MSRVVDMRKWQRQREAEAAFGRWEQRIGYRPTPHERLSQLPPEILSNLAELKHPATLALYDVVLGVRGLGAGERFPYLEPRPRLEALDAFLFLADQVRFELMVRLGWLEPTRMRDFTIVEMAKDYRDIQAKAGQEPPRLTQAYPSYAQVKRRLEMEPEAVVRSIIPQALEAFKEQLA